MRVGILGGTFDPIHRGHLAAARASIDALNLDCVLLVPAGLPSHRPAAVASTEHRWHMVQAACADDARLKPSRIDIDRQVASYSIDTVREVAQAYPAAQLFLIVGQDAYADFNSWRDPQTLRELTTVVVVSRVTDGHADTADNTSYDSQVVTVPLSGFDISATAIRTRVALGEPIDDLVPPGVAEYIAQNGLYR